MVRVRDGEELGSAVLDYPHGVLDHSLPSTLAGTDVRLGPDWALQVPADYVAVLRSAVPAALADAGVDPGQVIGIATDFTACTMLPTTADGTPLCELPGPRRRPARLRQALEAPRRAGPGRPDQRARAQARRGMAAPLRRPDLVGVGVRQGARAARGGAARLRRDGALRRGGRLDRLAAVRQLRAERLHGRLQGHPPGRRATRPAAFLAELNPGFAGFVDDKLDAPIGAAGRGRRHADGRGGRAGRACPRASPWRSATSTPT